jgi:hypothetical protein
MQELKNDNLMLSLKAKYFLQHKWHDSHLKYLIDLYFILIDIVNTRYPKNKIDWSSNKIFNNFSKLVYHCSSKHISKFLD